MKIEWVTMSAVRIVFTDEELKFIECEAKDNGLGVIEMLEHLLGMLFVGGYSNMAGKD